MEAAEHELHQDLEHLVSTGKLRQQSACFIPAFQALGSTSAAKLIDLTQLPTDLLVTEDFMRTVKKVAVHDENCSASDSFLRPVQWVVSVPSSHDQRIIQHLVILSPHEANKLKNLIKGYGRITLHIFMPYTNASYAPLDKLQLYNVGRVFVPESVPHSLTAQLNLFAGSLYLDSYEEYVRLCDFLGLLPSTPADGQHVYADGFISPPAGKWGLRTSPIPFLRALLLRIRREGDGLEKTHLGKILNGVRLEEADFRQDTEMSGT
jgi:hypothetical protein